MAISLAESAERCEENVVPFTLTMVGCPLDEKAYESYIIMEPKSSVPLAVQLEHLVKLCE